MAKNIFIAATAKDAGKSTVSLALIHKLTTMGKKVGFMKPVGQRWLPSQWGDLEEDVILMKKVFQFEDDPGLMNPVVVRRGFTEEYMDKLIKPDIEADIIDAYKKLSFGKDYMIIEGTGHAGVGAVIGKSNAEVAAILDSDVIIVVKGGVGSTIDQLDLNLSYFRSRGVNVIGIIANKVIPSKLEKITKYLKKYCTINKLKLFAVIPYSPILSNPTLGQIINELKPELISDIGDRNRVVDDFLVGASTLEEFIEIYKEKMGNLMLIIPSTRMDIIFSLSNINKIIEKSQSNLLSILFSGMSAPSETLIKALSPGNINLIWKKGDTFTVTSKLSAISIKTRWEDQYKIKEIQGAVADLLRLKQILPMLKNNSIKIKRKNLFRRYMGKFIKFWS